MQYPSRGGLTSSWLAGLLCGVLALAVDCRIATAQQPDPVPNVAPLFRNLFRAFGVPEGKRDNSANGAGKDSIDARIPKDPQIDTIWKASQEAVQRQDWKQSVDLLQRLLDFPEDAVVEQERGRWESVRMRANRSLGELPAAALADYEKRYGGLARQLLNQQVARPDLSQLVEIATRYFHTDAGAAAAARLSRWHFDQQEFLLATHWNRDLWNRKWPATRQPGWQLQAAFAARQAGLKDFAEVVQPLLSPDAAVKVNIGGRQQLAREWWAAAQLTAPALPQPSNWREFGGDSTRISSAASGDPLLLPAWTQSLSDVPSVQEKLTALLRDLRDDSVPGIPAFSPIVMGDKLAFRDLRSVRVVERATGKTLWQTEEGVSPERILNGLPAQFMDRANAWRMRVNAQHFDDEFQGGAADMHPLTSWLYRDGTNGFLSCDAERLYVLEDLAVMTRNQMGYGGNTEGEAFDQFGATWASNRLSAYELSTGRLVWTIGGPVTSEAVNLPLAGTFFFGVPAVEAGELYVVGTTGQEIRLHALDPSTGRPKWSQLLAYSDTKIELDVARRWLGAPVAVRDGLIVCPTTVGWMVAVDRTRRCLLWGYRYWPRDEESEVDPASQVLMHRSLHESWSVGAPLMTQHEVLFAPPDSDKLVCLSLIDGRELWTADREEGLYQAVVDDAHLVIVGTSQIQMRKIADGETVWSRTWDAKRYPTGRGCLMGAEFAVPLSDGRIEIRGLKDGEIVRTLHVADQQPPLGNLIKVQGQFVSLGPDGCRVFEERTKFLAEMAVPVAGSGQDWQQRLRMTEYDLLQGQPQTALNRLQEPATQNWPAEFLEERRQLAWSAWMKIAMAEPQQSSRALEELASMAKSTDERFAVESLAIAQQLARGEPQQAFQLCLRMARTPSSEELVSRPEQPEIQIRRDAWVAGQLQSLWNDGEVALRQTMTDELQAELEAAAAGTVADCQKLLPWSDFHPLAPKLRWKIAEEYARSGSFARAEAELLKLCSSTDANVAAESRLRLARIYQNAGLTMAATELVQSAQELSTPTTVLDGVSISDWLKDWELGTALTPPVSAWSAVQQHRSLKAERSAAAYLPQQQEVVPPLDNAYYRGMSVQLDPQDQRLSFQSREADKSLWMAPLRSVVRAEHSGYSPYQFLGHGVVVLHRNVLQMFSPVRRELAWTVSLDDDRNPVDSAHRPIVASMVDSSGLEHESVFWSFRSMHQGQLAVCNERAIAVTGRRSVTVFDPATGAMRWKHGNLPSEAYVCASNRALIVVDADCHPVLYDLMDGRRLAQSEEMRDSFSQTLAIVGDDVVQLDRKPGLKLFNVTTGASTLRSQNLLTGAQRWQLVLRPGTYLSRLDDQHVVLLGPVVRGKSNKHTLQILDMKTGKVQEFQDAPAFRQEESFTVLQDQARLYLIVNHGFSGNYSYGDSLPSTRVHGTLMTWDRQSGQMLWQRKLSNQNLSLDRFQEAPVLLFLARSWKQVGQASYTTLQLMALNKETGEILHDSLSPSLFSGFHGIRIDDVRQEVELLSYNQRLRLTPTLPAPKASAQVKP